MSGWRGLAAALCGAIGLAGCAGGELAKTESINLTGGDFRARLYQAYVELARTEYGEGDYANSDRFALRAQAVAAGASVEPETPKADLIPADKLDEMVAARRRLVALLSNIGNSRQAPHIARAQATYDCWVEEQEENRQPDHIALCRARFLDTVERVEVALAPPRPLARPKFAAPRKYVVYFDFDKARLDDEAKATLAAAMAEAQKLGRARLVVGGHTDLVGPDKYNQTLSEMRAAAAAQFLRTGGLEPTSIAAKGYGKSKPVKPTADPEPANRRVEISLETR
jgi:OmpA-OmpF porin, OOP family